MAERIHKWADNAGGAWYVDDQCIDCELCRDNAPEVFERNAAGGYSYVVRQPASAAEREHCTAAMECCPVGAIGCDGEG